MTTADSTTVRAADVRAALAALGIAGPPEDITQVTIDPDRITVRRFHRNPDGHAILSGMSGGEIAKVTTTISIDWSDQ